MTKKTIFVSSFVIVLILAAIAIFFTNNNTQARDVDLDGTPPTLTDGLPASNLPSGTTATTLGVTSDEGATCKYGTEPGVDYDTLTDFMITDDGFIHTASISGLSDGSAYTYYIRCVDASFNATQEDYIVTFSVEEQAATTYSVTGPTDGIVGRESTPFSVTPDDVFSGTVTVSYSGAGLSSSTTLTFDSSSATQTFTITPTEAGTVTLTFANNGALSDQSLLTYRVNNATRSGSASSTVIVTTKPVPATQPSQPDKPSLPTFTKNLSVGMIDTEVQLLQRYLNEYGYTVSSTGPGSKGNETEKFGRATRQALIRFQNANHLAPAVGFFGPVTRSFINNTL